MCGVQRTEQEGMSLCDLKGTRKSSQSKVVKTQYQALRKPDRCGFLSAGTSRQDFANGTVSRHHLLCGYVGGVKNTQPGHCRAGFIVGGGKRQLPDPKGNWQGPPAASRVQGSQWGQDPGQAQRQKHCQVLTACLVNSLHLYVFHLLDAHLTETLYNMCHTS